MISSLEDAPTIQRRARRPLVAAAVMTGAIIAPIVVAIFDSVIVHTNWTFGEIAAWYGMITLTGGLLAWWALGRAWRGVAVPLGRTVVRWSGLAGLALPAVLISVSFATNSNRDLGAAAMFVVIGVPFFTIFAGLVSVPIGAIFGLVFCSGVSLARDRIARPAHDTVAHAWACAAFMLVIATWACGSVAALVESAYCYDLFFRVLPALDVVPAEGTDAAWTRFVVLPGPLALAALVFGLIALIAHWRLARVARAIAMGTHPTWIADGSPGDVPDVLPLRACDRDAKQRTAIRPRHTSHGPYRTGEAPVAFIAR